jgi:hypothetical protein
MRLAISSFQHHTPFSPIHPYPIPSLPSPPRPPNNPTEPPRTFTPKTKSPGTYIHPAHAIPSHLPFPRPNNNKTTTEKNQHRSHKTHRHQIICSITSAIYACLPACLPPPKEHNDEAPFTPLYSIPPPPLRHHSDIYTKPLARSSAL